MKKDKVLPILIGVVIVGLLFAATYFILSDKGTEKYDVVVFGDSIIEGNSREQTIPSLIEYGGGYKTLNAGFGGMGMSNIANMWQISDSSRLYSMANLSESIKIHDFSNQMMGVQKNDEAIPDEWVETTRNLYCTDWNSVKYIIIEQGANDYLVGMPIEDESDKYSVNSFAGALRTVLKNIKAGAPNAKLIILTPIYQKTFDDLPDCHSYSFGGGTLDEYVEKEIEIAEEYGVYVIDNFHEVDINISNYKNYLPGGLHPNEAGNELIANNIVKHLEELDENS